MTTTTPTSIYTQQQEMHNEIYIVLREYHSGLFRDADLLRAMAHIANKYKDIDLGNSIDINTGERYPAVAGIW
jgi:hypothetical protein